MSGELDDDLFHDPDLAQFYDLANRERPDFPYCMGFAKDADSVLDLGCGTGELAIALAQGITVGITVGSTVGRTVTGVDPAAAMLEIARKRPGGGSVTWQLGDARSVRLSRRFDLVMLTGHAFQVFLTDEDQIATLRTIAAHLNPNGRFIFDSRNPAIGVRENRERTTVREFDHSRHGRVEAWNESAYDETTQILSYENGYTVLATGKTVSGPARIRYTPQERLAANIEAAGLVVDRWLGDWLGAPYRPAAAEIIPIGRLA